MRRAAARKPGASVEQTPRQGWLRWVLIGAVFALVVGLGVGGWYLWTIRDQFRPARGPITRELAGEVSFLPDATITVADNATPLLEARGVVVLRAEVFLRGHGMPRRPRLPLTVDPQGRLSFAGDLPDPRMRVYGTATRESPETWAISYTHEAEEAHPGKELILRFHFRLDAPVFTDTPTAPRPDGIAGWRWPLTNTTAILCNVNARAARVEQPGPGVIDVVLHAGGIPAGAATAIVRVTVPGEIQQATPAAERRGPLQPSLWPAAVLSPDDSPVDLRFLNEAPAGDRGFVRADGGRLVFDDGTPVRFWGTNVTAYALFVDHETIDRHAERIARLGYNMVRLHHHDSTRWVSPSVIDKSRADTRRLDAKGMERFDYWVAALRARGVYTWLDIHTGRMFVPGDAASIPGGIAGFEEIAGQEGQATVFNYLNPGLQRLMAEFTESFLTHVNPYTGRAYADEPAVAGIAITNENNITGPLANRLLSSQGNPVHAEALATRLALFAEQTGQPARAFRDWWGPGRGKLFLNDVEAAFHRDALTLLADLGVRTPVATTQYWAPGVQSSSWALPALALGDVIAVHSYGQAGFLGRNPAYEPTFATDIAGGRVAGLPLVVTEWGLDDRPVDRIAAPLYMAALGALQGWDGLLAFNYAQHPIGARNTPPTWSQMHDPGALALAPAAALLYRRGDLETPAESGVLLLDEDTLLRGVDARTSESLRRLAERMPIVLELPGLDLLPWHRPRPAAPGALAVAWDAAADELSRFAAAPEFQRDWEAGRLRVNTPRTQAAAGWLDEGAISLDDIVIAMETPFAAVAVSSLTDEPLSATDRVLLSVAGRTALTNGVFPFRSEPVSGEIVFNWIVDRDAWVCRPLLPDGSPGAAAYLRQTADGASLPLPGERFSHWYLLERRTDAPESDMP